MGWIEVFYCSILPAAHYRIMPFGRLRDHALPVVDQIAWRWIYLLENVSLRRHQDPTYAIASNSTLVFFSADLQCQLDER